MKRILNFAVLSGVLVAFFLNIGTASAQWVSAGPEGGYVRSIALSGDTLYAITGYATGDALYRSTDNGNTWAIIYSNSIPGNMRKIVKFGNSLFLGCGSNFGDNGIYRSDDNGITWVKKSTFDMWVTNFAVSGTTLFAGTTRGLLRTLDNGETWTNSNNGLILPYIYSLVADESNVYIGIGDNMGIFRSVNNGNTWSQSSNGMGVFEGGAWYYPYISILVSIGSDLYAGSEGNQGIFKSSDNGANWTLTNPVTNNYFNIKAIAGDASEIFALTASQGVLRSTDGGANWTESNNIDIYTNSESLVLNRGYLFLGASSGIYRSADSGDNWIEANRGIHAHQTTMPSLVSLGSDIFVGSRYAGVFRSSDAGVNWINVNNGLPLNESYLPSLNSNSTSLFAYDQLSADGGNNWIPSNSPGSVGYFPWIEHKGALFTTKNNENSGIFRSLDNGATWTTITNGIDPTTWFYTEILLEGGSMFVGTNTGGYYSLDDGDTWHLSIFPNGNSYITAGNYVTTGTAWLCGLFNYGGRGIFRSGDKGVSWTKVNNLLVYKTVISGSNIYATGTNLEIVLGEETEVPCIFWSHNDGQTWSKISANLGTDLYFGSLTAEGSNVFISKTSEPNYGVYFSNNNGINWIDASQGIYPKSLVTSLTALNNEMYAGTMGCSLWQLNVNAFSLPTQPSPIIGAASPCFGSSQIYSVINEPGVTYSWQFPSNWIVAAGGTTSSVTVTVGHEPGVVFVTPSTFAGTGPVQYSVLNVNTAPATPVISQEGNTLFSDASEGNQWYMNDVLIDGATNSTFEVTMDGTYFCIVTANGCSSDPSSFLNVIYTRIANPSSGQFKIFPVPSNGLFTAILVSPSAELFTIRVYNNIGMLIFEMKDVQVNGTSNQTIDMRPVPSGIYTVTFTSGTSQVVRKMLIKRD